MSQQQQLKELGSKLDTRPSTKDSLLKLLKQAVTILSDVDQSPSASTLESMQLFLKAIVKPELLKHQDKDVKLLVASCLCEITRITAPEAPYSDDILKDVFGLIVGTLSGLSDTNGPSFGRRVIMLETIARYRSCVVMLDLECDDLVREMVRTFIAVARDDHPENVLTSMRTIMIVLIEESEDVDEDLLLILLSTLGRKKRDITHAARKLAMSVIEHCSGKLEPAVKHFLVSSMSGDNKTSNGGIDYHEITYDLYCCSPGILSGVVPYLTGELLNDQSEARLRVVRLAGDLFALPGSAISEAFQPIFVEFLKRLTDREVEVRMTVLDYVKSCLLSNPSRPEASHIYAALCDRLLDYDENVRKQVVAVVCDVACYDLNSIPVETAKLVAERLRDKSLLVKKYTLDRLAEMYRLYCLRKREGCVSEYEWIPGKILRCFYDKDFRSDAIEFILCESLFPAEYAVKDIMKQWIRILAGLDRVEVKALERILEQKQKLQQEMEKYLSLKQTSKDADVPDFQKKVILLFRLMSRCFTDPGKAEEGFQLLDQLKDANVWKILSSLLDPNTQFNQACSSREELLKILGEKHQLHDFLDILSIKCSYILFSKEHVKEILSEAVIQKSAESMDYCLSCMNMLVILARYSPLLLIGSEEDLLQLLKDENETIKEGILHVLARAGGTIREKLTSSSSSVDLILERLCLEGTRRQAKYAVHALAAITKDDGLRSLSVLYKRLVDMLEENTHLPTVLQSLGCIAQTAMAVFETRENEIVEFIMCKILQHSNNRKDRRKARWHDQSENCMLKIFGIKTLVKSYLPVKDAHLRGGIDNLIVVLKNMLCFGEISKDIESSSVDRAHLRLASAKAVLRLSRYWDHKIPVDVFHLTLKTVEINFRQARKFFLSKVHQYIKDRVLDAKYACAFMLNIFRSKYGEFEEDKHNLGDIIQMCCQLKARQLSVQSETNPPMPYPEYILPYLVHVIAHHPLFPDVEECMDVKAFEPTYRLLYLFLSMVVHGVEDARLEASTSDKEKESIFAIISMLQCIKHSEDVIDVGKSKNSHALCDLGLSIIKRLAQRVDGHQDVDASVSLPPMLYKPCETKEDNAEAVEVRTWFTDDSIASHFGSLTLEVNGAARSELPEDEILEDTETDGNEMPLGKLIKHLKSKKAKLKKAAKANVSSNGALNDGSDLDILKLVREIDSDNLGISHKFEPSDAQENDPVDYTKSDEEHHNKKRKDNGATSSPVPKRRRSSSTRSPSKYSSQGSMKKESMHNNLKDQPSMQEDEPWGSNFLVSHVQKKRTRKGSDQDNDEGREALKADATDGKRPKVLVETEKMKSGSSGKYPMGSTKKRKRKSIAGLAKCSTKEGISYTTDLVDCRIKVWWPMDKQFYEGVVKSYDPEKGKHVVLYDDGDVEVLRLDKERWELIDDGLRPKKKSKTPRGSSRAAKPDKKSKVPERLRQMKTDKRLSRAKGSRTLRKTSKQEKEGVSEDEAIAASEESENRSHLSNAEPTVTSEVDEPESGELKRELTHDEYENAGHDEEEKSESGGREEGDREESQDESEESDKVKASPVNEQGVAGGLHDSERSDIGKSCSEDKQVDNSGEASQHKSGDDERPDEVDSKSIQSESDVGSGGSGDPDDKPLSTWKQRVKKAPQGK